MGRPRLLDLYSGSGGAAFGYFKAGFDVTGIDIKNQPHYPCFHKANYAEHFHFHQADALTYPLEGFDAYHASPPCQGYGITQFIPNRDMSKYPKLIEPTRERLLASGKPFVIENVMGAPLIAPIMLCGTMFGLHTRRHRLFEVHPQIALNLQCAHWGQVKQAGNGKRLAYYSKNAEGMVTVAGHLFSLPAGRMALDIDWMTRDELAQAIPPAYTEYIGLYLLRACGVIKP